MRRVSEICIPMRRLVLKRDRYKCRQCGGTEGLAVHHIRYRVPCRVKDLVTLCNSCHLKLHRDLGPWASLEKFTLPRMCVK